MTDNYPHGTRAEAPGWSAIKRDGIWWGGDFRGLRLGEEWEVPAYAILTLPGQTSISDPAEIAARVFAKRRELEAEQVAMLCDAKIQPDDDDPFGRFCNREAGHSDEDGEGAHHWI